MRYKAAIFDLDGTLLDTLMDLVLSVNHVLKENGEQERSVEQIRSAIGNGNRRLMALSISGGENNPDFEKLYNEYVQYYRQNDTVKTCPFDVVMEVLSFCRNNHIKTGIISNKVQIATEHLSEHYFSGYIDVTLGDNEKRPRKPAPDVGILALEMLGVLADEALYIGDSPVDSEFAEAVGMDCLLVSYGFNDMEAIQNKPCIAIAKSPIEILNYL